MSGPQRMKYPAKKTSIDTSELHNIDAEQAVLGAIFIDPLVLAEVSLLLKTPSMFYRESHRHIYTAMLDLSARGQEIDWVTVAEHVRRQNAIESCGGVESLKAYLSEISHAVPSSYGATGYAAMIRERYVMREIAFSTSEINQLALTTSLPASSVLDKLTRLTTELSLAESGAPLVPLGRFAQQVVENHATFKALRESGAKQVPGVATGFADVDLFTSGWKDGELIVIGARPGQGKTALALTISDNVAEAALARGCGALRSDRKGGVAYFSLEMKGAELVQRIICSRAGVDQQSLKLGKLAEDEELRLEDTAAALASLPFYLDESPSLSMSELRAKSRVAVRDYGVELIVLDYMQLLRKRWHRMTDFEHVSECSAALKMLARELCVPVLALAQFNREIERRGRAARPTLSDLRGAGTIEQDADQVIFIHAHGDQHARVVPIELIFAKNRGGPTGPITLSFKRWRGRFDNADPSETQHDQTFYNFTEPQRDDVEPQGA